MIKHVQIFTSTILLFFIGFGLQAKDYKGAEIYSNQSYKYGRFEMRMQSAPGSGQLSTFFLYRNGSETNQTLWQEIDIEIFGKNSNQFQTNVIIEKTEGSKLMTEVKHTTPFSTQEFNTYVLEWTPDSITWYVNDSLYRTEKTNALFCNEAMSIRFNHWAANITSWVGVFDKTVLPTYQYVDYISYSTYTPGTGDNGSDFTFDWKDDFDSFNSTRWSKANWTFGENLTDFLPANAYTENGSLVLKLHSTIITPVGIADVSSSNIQVFPNPCSSELYCNTPTTVSCKIISNTGLTIIPAFTIIASTKADISKAIFDLPSGLYYLIVSDNNGITETISFIKE